MCLRNDRLLSATPSYYITKDDRLLEFETENVKFINLIVYQIVMELTYLWNVLNVFDQLWQLPLISCKWGFTYVWG